MKSLPKNGSEKIDVESEIKAVTDFLRATWDIEQLKECSSESNENALDSLVKSALLTGYNALPQSLMQGGLMSIIRDLKSDREDQLESMQGWGSEFPLHDGLMASYRLLAEACVFLPDCYSDENLKILDSALSSLRKTASESFKGLSVIFPKGYEDFTPGYGQYDSMSESDIDAHASQFQGHDASTAGAGDLPFRLSLTQIAYDDHEQGRPPETVLLNVLFQQGLILRRHNNTVDLKQELSSFADNAQPFSLSLHTLRSNESMLNHVWSHVDHDDVDGFEPMTEAKADDMRAKKAKWDALNPEEQTERRKSTMEAIVQRLKLEEPGL
jgi:flagellar basal body rod protein FlgB